jgi:hypothetical protein
VSARSISPVIGLRTFEGSGDSALAIEAIERGVYALNEAEFSVSHTPHCEELMYGR